MTEPDGLHGKMRFFADQVVVQPSAAMLPTAWIGYDAQGRLVQSGVLGIGVQNETEDSVVAKIICGKDFHARLREMLEAL